MSEATGREKLTTAGVALGTPAYMAPEQASADPHLDHRVDIYAVGAVAYELLTGRPVFMGTTPQMILSAHVTENPQPVTKHRDTVPPALEHLVLRCLEKKPADRFQTAEELLPQLEALATPSGGITPTQTQPVHAPSPRPKTRWSVIAAAAVVIGGLATAGAIQMMSRDTSVLAGDAREPVAVVPFEVQATDAALATLGRQTADRIASGITAAGLAAVVPFSQSNAVGSGPISADRAARIVSETGAATLVSGAIYQRGDSVEISAQVLRASDLRPVFSLPVEHGAISALEAPLHGTTQRVLGAIGRYLSPAAAGMDVTLFHPPSSLEAFRLLDRAGQLIPRSMGSREVKQLLAEALQLDSTLYEAAAYLAMSYWYSATGPNGHLLVSDSILEELEDRRERLSVGESLLLDVQKSWRSSPEDEYRAAMALLRADSGFAAFAMNSCRRTNRPEEALRLHALRDTSTLWGREWTGWEATAASAYHALGRFEEEAALARATRTGAERVFGNLQREARAVAAMGRMEELEQLITESYSFENPLRPGYTMNAAALELRIHGFLESARSLSERQLAWIETLPPETQMSVTVSNWMRVALRVQGRHEEVVARYAMEELGVVGRALAARSAILTGDTTEALGAMDALQRAPADSLQSLGWALAEASRRYYVAQIFSMLGRRDEAVAWLRSALNVGGRFGPDEALQWYWEPIGDYPPFQELVRPKG